MSTSLSIDTATISRLLADVGYYGTQGVETGAMLLSRPGSPHVSVLALAGKTGITRRFGLLVLSAEALAPLFEFAETHELQIRAQVHSHAREAFMSTTDKAGNIRMPGFIVGVVPNFKAPPAELATWGWWTFDGDDWTDLQPPTVTTNGPEAATVVFDSRGIHEDRH